MATADDPALRYQAIVSALETELRRQGRVSVSDLDITALAQAIEQALKAEPPASEGIRPENLSASNDG